MGYQSGKKIDAGYKFSAGILSTDPGFIYSNEFYGLSPNQLASDTWLREIPYAALGQADTVLDVSGANPYPWIEKITIQVYEEPGFNGTLYLARENNSSGNRISLCVINKWRYGFRDRC